MHPAASSEGSEDPLVFGQTPWMLTSRVILIPLKYDPASLEFHGVFGIPPAAKSGQPTTTWMSLADWRWCGATGMNGLAGGVGLIGRPLHDEIGKEIFRIAFWSVA